MWNKNFKNLGYYQKSMEIIRFILNLLGFSFDNAYLEGSVSTFKAYSCYFFNLFIFWITIVCEIIFILKALKYATFLEISELAPCLCYCSVALTKYLVIFLNRRVLKNAFETFEAMYPKNPTEAEQQYIDEYMGYSYLLTKWTLLINFPLIWCFNFFSLWLMGYEKYTVGTTTFILPYDAWYPFDYQNIYVWLPLLVYQFHSGIMASIGNNLCEWIFYTIVSHFCIQFKILAYKIQTIVDDQVGDNFNRSIASSEEISTVNDWKINDIQIDDRKIEEKLFECIQTHQKLINLGKKINDVFSIANFYNFCVSAILICLVGFNVTGLSSVRLVLFLFFFLVALIQIFFLCWFGNNLIESSTEVSSAAFNSCWYVTGQPIKTTLLVIMLRAQKPLKFTGLKFYDVSLKSFTSVMSTSWSYFTLLRTMYQPDS